MSKLKKYTVEPYNYRFCVGLIDDEKYLKKVLKWMGMSQELFESTIEGCDSCYLLRLYGFNGGALFLERDNTSDELVHECSHIVMESMRMSGATVDLDNQEPFAYGIQKVFSKVAKFYNTINH